MYKGETGINSLLVLRKLKTATAAAAQGYKYQALYPVCGDSLANSRV